MCIIMGPELSLVTFNVMGPVGKAFPSLRNLLPWQSHELYEIELIFIIVHFIFYFFSPYDTFCQGKVYETRNSVGLSQYSLISKYWW